MFWLWYFVRTVHGASVDKFYVHLASEKIERALFLGRKFISGLSANSMILQLNELRQFIYLIWSTVTKRGFVLKLVKQPFRVCRNSTVYHLQCVIFRSYTLPCFLKAKEKVR